MNMFKIIIASTALVLLLSSCTTDGIYSNGPKITNSPGTVGGVSRSVYEVSNI